MASINKVFIIGRLGKDPESKKAGESKVTKFSVATSEKYKDQETTTWHNIVVWGKLGELCVKFLKKGSQACIEGKIQTRVYDKDGEKKYFTEIVATNVMFLDSKPRESESETSYDEDSEIPF